MSFFHVLPSNAAPEFFPTNNAASFSTPVSNAYNLDGDWEVALMNLTHSNCIDTFANEKMTVEERNLSLNRFKDLKQPYTIRLSLPKKTDRQSVIDHILKEVNPKLKGYLEFKFEKFTTQYIVPNHGFILILSSHLTNTLRLFNDVVDYYDAWPSAYFPMWANISFPKGTEWTVTLVPVHYKETKFVLKEARKEIDVQTFVDRFNALIPKEVAYLSLNIGKKHVRVNKQATDGKVVSFSFYAQKACQYRQRCLYHADKMQFVEEKFKNYYWWEWSVSILDVGLVENYVEKLTTEIPMGIRQFVKATEVCDHLNEKVNDERIIFHYSQDNKIKLRITDENLKLTFSNDLRDILGFDQNVYTKSDSHLASATIAMNRHINYFYIYSNIGDNIRIGDTEAPLLAVIPFNPKPCQFVTEKSFKVPMYVPVVSKYISQIDIAIYDGAGVLIPFHEGAVTSARLHFRRK